MKKLSLKKVTLSQLDNYAMNNIKGGGCDTTRSNLRTQACYPTLRECPESIYCEEPTLDQCYSIHYCETRPSDSCPPPATLNCQSVHCTIETFDCPDAI